MTLQMDTALKLCREWNFFTFQLPLVDTHLTFGGLDWKSHEDYDGNELLSVMTPDGEYMQWTYNRNGTLQGHKTSMDERRLQGLKPILEKLQEKLDQDPHYEFCDGGHIVPRRPPSPANTALPPDFDAISVRSSIIEDLEDLEDLQELSDGLFLVDEPEPTR